MMQRNSTVTGQPLTEDRRKWANRMGWLGIALLISEVFSLPDIVAHFAGVDLPGGTLLHVGVACAPFLVTVNYYFPTAARSVMDWVRGWKK